MRKTISPLNRSQSRRVKSTQACYKHELYSPCTKSTFASLGVEVRTYLNNNITLVSASDLVLQKQKLRIKIKK